MSTINKKVIIASVFATATVTISLLGFAGALKQKTSNVKYADWMSKLDNNLSLREVNMPGSHDTMALYSLGDLAGQCQSLSLKEQLNLGVRFLDIRLKEENNKLKVVHGTVDQKASFDSVIKEVESFLKSHKDEFIIMSVKEEADSSKSEISFEECLKSYLNSDIYLKDTVLPNRIGDVRGKVVLLSRYSGSTIGIPAYSNWQVSSSFTMSDTDIYVQDTFKITSKEQKQEEIVRCFNETGHALKINFLSAYRTNYFPPSYSVSAAKDINPWINEEIKKYDDRGIVLYDFISEDNMAHFFGEIL